MGLGNRLRNLFRLFLLFTVLVAIALLSAITTIRLTIHGRQVNMPKLVGVSLESAQRLTGAMDLELKVVDKIYSQQYPANQIAQQMPPPGTRVKAGQHVHVLVSLGPPQLTVPNLVGDSVRAARITAIQQGLTVGDLAILPWSGDSDLVVAQDPAPATTQLRTPTVNLLISGGPEPAAYLCPGFVGQSIAEARRQLDKNGFKVGQATPTPAIGVSPGVILAQTPAPGSKIGPDAVFSFQVAE